MLIRLILISMMLFTLAHGPRITKQAIVTVVCYATTTASFMNILILMVPFAPA